MSDYIIPAGYGEAEHIDKKSRFIGQVQHAESGSRRPWPLSSAIRKKHADATHNVWAYVLQRRGHALVATTASPAAPPASRR